MSSLVMRPAAPVPSMAPRSTLCSLARRRTNGEEWMRSVELPEETAAPGAEDCAAAGGGACGAGAAGLAAAGADGAGGAAAAGVFAGAGGAAGAEAGAAPVPSITATMVWMGTVWPSAILISFSTPAEGEGISASTLSVEISKSGSSRSTLSPGFLSHLVMVPSKMLSPIWGMTTSTAMLILSLPGGTHRRTENEARFAGELSNLTSLQGKTWPEKGGQKRSFDRPSFEWHISPN